MKKMRCYGRAKNSVVTETSVNRRFFEENNFQNSSLDLSFEDNSTKHQAICSGSSSKLQDSINSALRELFDCPNNEFTGPKLTAIKKKKKNQSKKLVKVLGKNKKKIQNKTPSPQPNIPRWVSIYEYSLNVEKSQKKKDILKALKYNYYNSLEEKGKVICDEINLERSHCAVEVIHSCCTSAGKCKNNRNNKILSIIVNQECISKLNTSKNNEEYSVSSHFFPVSPIPDKFKCFKTSSTNVVKCNKVVTSTPATNKKYLQVQPLNLSVISAIENSCDSSKEQYLNFPLNSYKTLPFVRHLSRSLKKSITNCSVSSALLTCNKISIASFLSKSCENFSVIKDSVKTTNYYNRRSYSEKVSFDLASSCNSSNASQSILSKLLQLCGQDSIIPFKDIYIWREISVRKIGEGTFGEVFTLVQKKLSTVIKVIPFSEDNDNHSIQSIETVFSEVKVSQCLSELRNNKNNQTKNFNKLKSVHLVKGCYPEEMLIAWDNFSCAKTSYNSRPDIFYDQQLFAILVLEYGGKDMTSFVLRNAVEAQSILKQITLSLAIAEEVHFFEHRDLHLGNILVQRTKSKTISYVLRGKQISIPSQGVLVTIIDFTLSRVLLSGCVFYNNLAIEESLFNQNADFQFEVYRLTKTYLKNEWYKSLLYSNVLWLTYLCMKLLGCEYSRPSSKKHQYSLQSIRMFQKDMDTSKNALECLKVLKIVKFIPERDQYQDSKPNTMTKFIDRKSFQK